MTHLADKICTVASENEGIKEDEIPHYMAQIHGDWQIEDEEALKRKFTFKGFIEAVNWAEGLTELVESQGHHPEITITYGTAEIKFHTPEVQGLHENDFIMAARIDKHQRKDKASN